ncbi:hypothetical protein A0128_20280 [Leptospira tipperaryensis]|uniref:Uncharacterized protein n=1 Tax=Leptospira tipperaryensis TaxID=2564040 RepID=A0A1D7V3F9_9LEPT|nr:hypothetical protein A0128_20280 [Leptospira tipperaryensis]
MNTFAGPIRNRESPLCSDNFSVKAAGPALILGGGVGGGKNPETFLYHKIILFARKKFPCIS